MNEQVVMDDEKKRGSQRNEPNEKADPNENSRSGKVSTAKKDGGFFSELKNAVKKIGYEIFTPKGSVHRLLEPINPESKNSWSEAKKNFGPLAVAFGLMVIMSALMSIFVPPIGIPLLAVASSIAAVSAVGLVVSTALEAVKENKLQSKRILDESKKEKSLESPSEPQNTKSSEKPTLENPIVSKSDSFVLKDSKSSQVKPKGTQR